VEDFPDVIEMITYMKSTKDQIGDDFGRPTIPVVTTGSGSVLKQGFEFLFLHGRQSTTSSAARFSFQTVQAVAIDFLPPSFEGGKRDVESIDDVIVSRSVKNHIPRQESSLAAVRNPFRCTHALQYERNRRMVHFLGGGQYMSIFDV
jgi:hypothetical protein